MVYATGLIFKLTHNGLGLGEGGDFTTPHCRGMVAEKWCLMKANLSRFGKKG